MQQNPAAQAFIERLKPKREMLTVSLSFPRDLLEWIDDVARRNQTSRSDVFKALAEEAKANEEGVLEK